MSETPPPGAPLLETRGLSKRFGGVHALEGVDFRLRAGEVVALAGDNGAGKSTFTKLISGVFAPSGGEILVGGETVAFDGPQAARRRGIETIYQDLALADNLDVGGNLFLGRELMTRTLGLPRVDRRRMREEAAKALAVLDVRLDRPERPVRALSGGQRQAVAIGRAIYWDARIIIMDEPTAALGVPEQRKVMELVRSLRDRGLGVIFISHNLADMFAVSDRIVVLRRGRLAGERAADETEPEEIVRLMVGRDEGAR
ncbi:MAG: sugar ABC transporter ATP-binding protein [Gluconacetobacter diazotrophicus]|nr:sugar ABC transporter ATP-binding protein [Gluconacetobacter diazotrophicus]